MIILMGLAGSGKGTQAQFLSERYGYKSISTGEILRQYANEDQKRRMLVGELLRDDEINTMVDKTLATVEDPNKCLLDGFPRSITQAEWLLSHVSEKRLALPTVIYIHISEEVVRQRLVLRGRADDTDASITKRFEEYRHSTQPITDYFKAKGIQVYQVEGDQTPEAVHADIAKIISE
jgi:adenylate kinase